MKTKTCTKCKEKRPLSNFSVKEHRNGKRYLRSHCNRCRNKATAIYHKQHPEITRCQTLRRYGMTLEQYDELFGRQNGECFICSQPETVRSKNGKVKLLAVDHDHKTGIVRGLLCNRCNVILGLADDNIDLLKDIIDYLRDSSPGPQD